MANNWYINISTEDKSIIPKAAMDFIIANWYDISGSTKLPLENSKDISLTARCGDMAKKFLDDLALTSDGIKMKFSSESTMSTEISIYISKNGKWEHLEDIVGDLMENIGEADCQDYYGKKHTAFLKKLKKLSKDELILLQNKYLKSLKIIEDKTNKLDKQKNLLYDKKYREYDIVLHINSELNKINDLL